MRVCPVCTTAHPNTAHRCSHCSSPFESSVAPPAEFEKPVDLDYLRLIDTQTGGQRYDVTPLFADARAFALLIENLAERCGDLKFDVVVGIDALGFILGAGLALHVRRGFVPIRKGGKLPVEVDRVEFTDYSGQQKALEMRVGAVSPGTRVLVVDEWIDTGAQATTTIALIERQRGVVAGVAGIHMEDNPVTRSLAERYPCRVLSGWLVGRSLDD